MWSRIFTGIKGMVTLVQNSIHQNLWYYSRMKVNCIMLGITITCLLLSYGLMKTQLCIKLKKDGSWLLFWVFNFRSKRKSLGPGMVLHDFYCRVQETEPCRSLCSRLVYWASSKTTKLRQQYFWKIESGW